MNVALNQTNKALVWDFWQRMNYAGLDGLEKFVRARMHPDIAWHGPHPINALHGVEAVLDGYWRPLYQSFPDLKRTCDVFLGSESGGEYWVSACGYLTGTFQRDWLGIPASGEKTHIHFGQHYRIEDGLVVENYLILDLLAVIRQAGYQLLPPARGAEGGKFLPPATADGVLLTAQDPLETLKTRQLVSAMLQGMMRFDGKNLATMEMAHYWHPEMHWYGPSGIGACYSLEQFEDFHQRPWLQAFPDRGLSSPPGRGRMIGIENGEILAEGRYASLGIWDIVFSVNRGPFRGFPPTARAMTIRDFDWYRRDGERLVQNWVPIDLIDLFLQMGVDLFAVLAQRIEERKAGKGKHDETNSL
jgi:predicted ester cyclase